MSRIFHFWGKLGSWRYLILYILFGFLIVLLFINFDTLEFLHNWSTFPDENVNSKGKFSDIYSALNTLFTGLAFAGVILTMIMQSAELRLQRKELEENRAVMKDQASQLKQQKKEMEQSRLDAQVERVSNSILREIQYFKETAEWIKFTAIASVPSKLNQKPSNGDKEGKYKGVNGLARFEKKFHNLILKAGPESPVHEMNAIINLVVKNESSVYSLGFNYKKIIDLFEQRTSIIRENNPESYVYLYELFKVAHESIKVDSLLQAIQSRIAFLISLIENDFDLSERLSTLKILKEDLMKVTDKFKELKP